MFGAIGYLSLYHFAHSSNSILDSFLFYKERKVPHAINCLCLGLFCHYNQAPSPVSHDSYQCLHRYHFSTHHHHDHICILFKRDITSKNFFGNNWWCWCSFNYRDSTQLDAGSSASNRNLMGILLVFMAQTM